MSAAPITPANCWSVLQCHRTAAALDAKADSVVQGLDAFACELGIGADEWGTRCEEHQAAVTLIGHLLELVQHLRANLNGGMALPPTPQPTRAAQAVKPEPPTAIRPINMRAQVVRPVTQAEHIIATARAEGLLAIADCCARTGYQRATWDKHVAKGLLPQPHEYRLHIPFWKPEQLAGVKYVDRRSLRYTRTAKAAT